ncbi:hypothetical protein P153DRAFT_161102 [Dothidotthia symphoricarpi CBS 119687]|uniref:Zn(2)-C6 fungal-type domain-containing protein n=1 Tax=Dothidotthia symphoricarpi CBS 119687 TaxID=1392245 RepID=A0A6A6AR35_9PLEO|nr:uncharacterized protein P153DRAFT_161102 [Dothidotthia symphoricarpi CBS 119687]KAF2133638.1 hypothetical protein P153DRAFT_161102 [Dothidotthia symphoricarpi CBS 119687]
MANLDSSFVPTAKLRSTCKECALSKVRCEKQKPTCRRCESHDFECVYDRSKRRGKPRATKQHLPTYTWYDADLLHGVTASPSFTSPLSQDIGFDPDLWCTSNISYVDVEPHPSIFRGIDDESCVTLSNNAENKTILLPEPTMLSCIPPRLCQDEPCMGATCTDQTLRILSALCHVGSANRTIGGLADKRATSSSIVLGANRAALKDIEQVLSKPCTYCVQDANVCFLVATAMSKILAWYFSVLESISELPELRSTSTSELVLMTPIVMGQFQLDRVAETRMSAQLLLCELQCFGIVLSLLEQRKDRSVQGREVSSTFHAYLRESLRVLNSKLQGLIVPAGGKER